MEETKTQADWKCNTCGDTEGVENGVCPTCGPTQTTPLSEAAQKEAGVAEAAGAKEVVEGEVVEPTSTEK